MVCSCGTVFHPEASLVIKVTDEHGEPIKNAEVGLGFEQGYKNGSPFMKTMTGYTDNNGLFKAKKRTSNLVTYGAIKVGYYRTNDIHKFSSKAGNRWEPWGQEVKVVLRKIEKPVPMYAREVKLSLPTLNENVGYDLVKSDWMPPYGQGIHSDIAFNAKIRWKNEHDFDGILRILFSGSDGLIKIEENMISGSQFKLPRYAPEAEYKHQLTKHIYARPDKDIEHNYNKNISYIVRIRSTNHDETKPTVLYGKIRGDFSFDIKNNSAIIVFTYYLNPDHTRNLEFDPKRNLFTNLPVSEQVNFP